jgi:hypothetical protein
MAKLSPMSRARGWSAAGSLLVTIEMKMMLSIPKITSKKVRVKKAMMISGLMVTLY